ncbi:MFS transporter [Jonesia quinghaiensis]|uniref:MFS transporter n=1 Tax=Jonesia quinghaiensis TaxID=262806 RepID=UPI0003FECC8E|nr:MFS transporter [Jonesia quinghaiensis]
MASVFVDTSILKSSPEFARLWWGLGVSNIGAQITVVAVGLEVYAITESTFSVGMIGLSALIPLVVLGLYGGALVDAYDRRKIALIASTVLWVTSALLAAQAFAGFQSVGLLYALVAVQSAAFAVNNPARQAILPRIVPPEKIPAANSLMTITWNAALFGGPLLAALLVGAGGYGIAYAVDTVLFTCALWALFRLPSIPPSAPTSPSQTDPVNTAAGALAAPPRRRVGLRSVLDGLSYLRTQPDVRMTFLVDLAAMILASPRVLFPALGVVVLGGEETTVGVLTAAFAVGAMSAGLFSGGLTAMHRQGLIIAVAITAWGVSVIAFGALMVAAGESSPETIRWGYLVAGAVALFFAGASDAISAVFRQTILQTATPDHMRGRLQGVFIVVVAGGPRLGDVWLGTQSQWFGEGWAAVAGGVACIIVLWALMLWYPRFLRYDARTAIRQV